MKKKGRKKIYISLLILALLIIGSFALNWYMTFRLEDHLRQRLANEVHKATDGLYIFSFDKLDVGLFNGELAMKGVKLTPDSTIFNQWKQKDSLPQTYLDVYINEIHFKGVNLTWRKNYKNLNFKLFEITAPTIDVYGTISSLHQPNKDTEARKFKTLHEIISPYIDILSVNKINLANATISYSTNDSLSPVIYSLRDANFKAFDFLLNENSHKSGKLLYCDNFEFAADTHQELLKSNQLELKTEKIKLSTSDSTIVIEGIRINPNNEFWKYRTERNGGYLKSEIKSVIINGISFRRENTLNYLKARSFNVSSTNIEYFSVKKGVESEQQLEKIKIEADTSDHSWSLYNLISPVLYRVSIKEIAIGKTKFDYTLTKGNVTDVFNLGEFDFRANNFLIDSVSENQKKFWYVDNFILEGKEINSSMQTKNVMVKVDRLYLNTSKNNLSVSGIKMKPLSPSVLSDKLSGDIERIDINGLAYNKGISANTINIESADIQYNKQRHANGKSLQYRTKNNPDSIFDLLNPYASFISVKNININKSNLSFRDKQEAEYFRLNNFNFYATNFLANEKTLKHSKYLFTCENFGLRFKNFDNDVFNNSYRLQIAEGDLSNLERRIILKDIKLIPRKEEWMKTANIVATASASLFDLKGLNYETYINEKNAVFNSLTIKDPHITIIKTEKIKKEDKAEIQRSDIASFLSKIAVDTVNISNSDISYINKQTGDSLQTKIKNFLLRGLAWDLKEKFTIEKINLKSPSIIYSELHKKEKNDTKNQKRIAESLSAIAQNIELGELASSDIFIHVNNPNLLVDSKVSNIDISHLATNYLNEKSELSLLSAIIEKPTLYINKKTESIEKSKKPDQSSFDLYKLLGQYTNKLSIGYVDIRSANFNYDYLLKGSQHRHQTINSTNLIIKGLKADATLRELDIKDIRFDTKDLSFPIMNGFYTIGIGKIDLSTQKAELELSKLSMTAAYSKTEFAYKHPKHKDWFDVNIGNIKFEGIDYRNYFSNNLLKINDVGIHDAVLGNYKNQNIEIEHNIMPLIYEGLQKLPIKLEVNNTNITNFSVIYEELAKGKTTPGKISFMGMDGRFKGLTNVVSSPDQFITLDVSGKFMGTGQFDVSWLMPVDSTNDCFILNAHLQNFDLTDLNQIISPMAPAKVESGFLKEMKFSTQASSKNANVNMLFLYNDLNMSVFKDNGTEVPNKLFTNLANRLLRTNNPNKKNKRPRNPNLYIERDPYHSTFNYFWQIVQPPILESVGVSQKKQNFLKKATNSISRLKHIFTPKKKNEQKTK